MLMVRFSSRRFRRWVYGLLLLLATVSLLILAAAGASYAAGLRVSEPGWQDGLTLGQWRVVRDGCVVASGTGLAVQNIWPLHVKQQNLTLYDCGADDTATADAFPDGLPLDSAFPCTGR